MHQANHHDIIPKFGSKFRDSQQCPKQVKFVRVRLRKKAQMYKLSAQEVEKRRQHLCKLVMGKGRIVCQLMRLCLPWRLLCTMSGKVQLKFIK